MAPITVTIDKSSGNLGASFDVDVSIVRETSRNRTIKNIEELQ
jgi:hypothetical protein